LNEEDEDASIPCFFFFIIIFILPIKFSIFNLLSIHHILILTNGGYCYTKYIYII
jgi:hypothetical protein